MWRTVLSQKSENVRPHSSNSIKKDPIIVNPVVKMWPHTPYSQMADMREKAGA